MKMKQLQQIITGIYAVVNRSTKEIYVGQAKNIKQRIATHKSCLQNNKYMDMHLEPLQIAYNNDNNFNYVILKETTEQLLDATEDMYIEHYRCNGWTIYNKETNKEKKIRLSKGMATGHKKSEKCKNKYENCLHLDMHKKEILKMHYNKKSSRYIAQQFNCSHTLICRKLNIWI